MVWLPFPQLLPENQVEKGRMHHLCISWTQQRPPQALYMCLDAADVSTAYTMYADGLVRPRLPSCRMRA